MSSKLKRVLVGVGFAVSAGVAGVASAFADYYTGSFVSVATTEQKSSFAQVFKDLIQMLANAIFTVYDTVISVIQQSGVYGLLLITGLIIFLVVKMRRKAHL